ncbi:helix-turn-helix domain-containing protein [Altererythrobacter litoralis]|uniref:Helix-turn-helix domain-containing protein n=1 Tax=Altererythrobacter litoralis TaxID=3113904 RepID=A0ABU7GCD2_9SPHN|nr:helix-turn-helix domain-containing protein [Erythrobacteraceae bacterium 1XM1-14]
MWRHDRRHLYLEANGGLASGEQANVAIHNISEGGMLIETALELASGVELTVELPHEGAAAAQVVWTSGSLFGCRFLRPIGAAALSAVQLKADAPLPPLFGHAEGAPARGVALGKRLEQSRKARGLTLAQVADRLGVSKPTVWAWEKGKARPVDERFPAIADVLGLDAEELLEAQRPEGVSELLQSSREQIAQALGIDARQVRILIEI